LWDNAWHPFQPELYAGVGRLGQWGYQLRGRFWWVASIVHWAAMHFDLSRSNIERVKLSVSVVLIFAAIAFPLLIALPASGVSSNFGCLAGLPFWMSTFTLVHHTKQNLSAADQWQEVSAQLSGTVHCDYPWVEVLCHDINVHIPHHISTAIPSYNLLAHRSLQPGGLIFTIKVGSLGL